MRKPLPSRGTWKAPMNVSLSRKRSHHSLHAMNRNEASTLPEIRAHAADDHDQQNLIGHGGLERVRLHGALIHGQQRTAHPREEGADHEGHLLVMEQVDAHGLRRDLVVADRLECPTVGGVNQQIGSCAMQTPATMKGNSTVLPGMTVLKVG